MPRQIYKWRAWMDGEVHTAERGVHFEKDPAEFAKSVRTYARRHGMEATALTEGDTVRIQFFKGDAS